MPAAVASKKNFAFQLICNALQIYEILLENKKTPVTFHKGTGTLLLLMLGIDIFQTLW